MRSLALDQNRSLQMLGREHSQAFIGLVADFRAALFASDVPGAPISINRIKSNYVLNWRIANSCHLSTSLDGKGSADSDGWAYAYRIKLEGIELNGEVLI